jgi:hypothetical protein
MGMEMGDWGFEIGIGSEKQKGADDTTDLLIPLIK